MFQLLPTTKEHQQSVNNAIVICAIAIVIGVLYWWLTPIFIPQLYSNKPVIIDDKTKVMMALQNSPTPSATDIAKVKKALSASSKTKISEVQKASVTNALINK